MARLQQPSFPNSASAPSLSRLSSAIRACTGVALLGLAIAGLTGCATPSSSSSSAGTLSAEQVIAIVSSPDRSDADRNNDVRRMPAQMLLFIGVKPGMTAADLSAAGGYTTELIARAVGPTGRVYAQNPPRSTGPGPAQPEGMAAPAPAGPRPPPTSLATRAAKLQVGHIIPVTQPFEQPFPPEVQPGSLDLVTLMFNYHDLGHMGADRARMNRAVFAALKPGGMYVIADHSGRVGTGISESGTLHRIEEAFLQAEVEQAGFRVASEGFFLRNPMDPRDRNTPEPPQPKDDFVLKFVKP
jgi:predicted methyltransferase